MMMMICYQIFLINCGALVNLVYKSTSRVLAQFSALKVDLQKTWLVKTYSVGLKIGYDNLYQKYIIFTNTSAQVGYDTSQFLSGV